MHAKSSRDGSDSLAPTQEEYSFPQAHQEEASLSYTYVRGTPSFWPKWNGHQDALTRNKAGFPCSDLNAGSSCITQNEGMCECPVQTLEKDLVPHLLSTCGLTSL